MVRPIDADGAGFRGGGGRALGGQSGLNKNDFYGLSTNNAHGSKGEGVAGTPRYILYTMPYLVALNTGVAKVIRVVVMPVVLRVMPVVAVQTVIPDSNDQNSGGGGGGNGGAGGLGGNGWFSFGYTGGRGGTAFQTYGANR